MASCHAVDPVTGLPSHATAAPRTVSPVRKQHANLLRAQADLSVAASDSSRAAARAKIKRLQNAIKMHVEFNTARGLPPSTSKGVGQINAKDHHGHGVARLKRAVRKAKLGAAGKKATDPLSRYRCNSDKDRRLLGQAAQAEQEQASFDSSRKWCKSFGGGGVGCKSGATAPSSTRALLRR